MNTKIKSLFESTAIFLKFWHLYCWKNCICKKKKKRITDNWENVSLCLGQTKLKPKYGTKVFVATSSWQLVVFLVAIFNPWIVLHVQTKWWSRVKTHSEDTPEDNRPSTFSGISYKTKIPPDLFHFMTHSPHSILKLSLIIISIFLLLVMQSPHMRTVSWCLMSVSSGRCHRSTLLFWK